MSVGSEWWPIFRSEELVELLRFLVLLTAFNGWLIAGYGTLSELIARC